MVRVRINKNIIVFTSISLVAFVINILTLHNCFPWIDEVSMLDVCVNFAEKGEWRSDAWWPYDAPIYMPLYQFLMTIWYKIWGVSFFSGHLFNLFLYYMTGILLLRLMKMISEKQLNTWSIISFSMMFWLVENLASLYRSNRVDITCAFFSILFVIVLIGYIHNEKKYSVKIVLSSALVVMSGLQASIFCLGVTLFLYVLYWDKRRKITNALLYLILGTFCGILLTFVFMYHIGVWKYFVVNNLAASGTFAKLFLLIGPFFTKKQYFEENGWGEYSLFDKIREAVSSEAFCILLFSCCIILLISWNKKRMQIKETKIVGLLLSFSVFIVLLMVLAGRFQWYYHWMAYIPLIMALSMSASANNIKSGFVLFIAIFLSVKGYISMGSPNNKAYANMKEMIDRHQFEKSSRVAIVNRVYYEMKFKVDNLLFAEQFPCEQYGEVDYIIAPDFERKLSGYYRNATELKQYLDSIKNDSMHIVFPVDSCSISKLILYKVEKR